MKVANAPTARQRAIEQMVGDNRRIRIIEALGVRFAEVISLGQPSAYIPHLSLALIDAGLINEDRTAALDSLTRAVSADRQQGIDLGAFEVRVIHDPDLHTDALHLTQHNILLVRPEPGTATYARVIAGVVEGMKNRPKSQAADALADAALRLLTEVFEIRIVRVDNLGAKYRYLAEEAIALLDASVDQTEIVSVLDQLIEDVMKTTGERR